MIGCVVGNLVRQIHISLGGLESLWTGQGLSRVRVLLSWGWTWT
jgi:hypothetical protein